MPQPPESPSTRVDEASDVPGKKTESPTGAKERKKSPSEGPNKFETVPEAPTLTRQILMSSPFMMYQDIVDANDKKKGKENAATPAIFSVLEQASNGEFVQVTDGKDSFWINMKESKAQDWSVRQVLQKKEYGLTRSELRLSGSDNDKAAHISIPVTPQTVFPILEVGKEKWKRIGPDFKGKTTELKTMPLWASPLNAQDERVAQECYFVSEGDLKYFHRDIKSCRDAFSLLSVTEKNGSDLILDALQLSYLRLFGADRNPVGDASKTLDYVKSKTGKCSEALSLTMDNISQMDGEGFKQWLTQLTIGVNRCEELLSGKEGSQDLLMNGEKTKFFIIPFDQLP